MNRRNWAHGLRLFERSPCQFNWAITSTVTVLSAIVLLVSAGREKPMLDFLLSTQFMVIRDRLLALETIAHDCRKDSVLEERAIARSRKERLLKTGEIQPTAMSDRTLRGSDHKF